MRRKQPVRISIAATLIVLIWAAPMVVEAGAPQAPESPLYKIDWRRDVPILGVGGSFLTAALLWHPNGKDKLDKTCPAMGCDTNTVNGFDRPFAGKPYRSAPHILSNVLEVTSWVAPLVLDRLDVSRHGLGNKEFVNDSIVHGETMLLNWAFTEMTKRAVWRPRPFAYQPAAHELDAMDTYQSFYSGHTSTAFATSFGYATTYARRHPLGKKKLAYSLAIGLGSTVGVLRIAAHKHFPTDVIVGAVSGIAVGWAVPALHRY